MIVIQFPTDEQQSPLSLELVGGGDGGWTVLIERENGAEEVHGPMPRQEALDFVTFEVCRKDGIDTREVT